MRTVRWVMMTALVLASSTARAEQTSGALDAPAPEQTQAREATGSWSIGAGVGLSGFGVSSYGVSGSGLAGVRAEGLSTLGVALLERTLTPALRLGLAATGGYTRTNGEHEGDLETSPVGDSRSSTVAALLTLRWVLNPGDLVEVSPLVALGGRWLRSDGHVTGYSSSGPDGLSGWRREQDTKGYGLEGRLGLAVEYRLISRLYLRFESHFASVGASNVEVTNREISDDAPTVTGTDSADTLGVSFGFQPFLQLRVVL
jgi:hypothetical protein